MATTNPITSETGAISAAQKASAEAASTVSDLTTDDLSKAIADALGGAGGGGGGGGGGGRKPADPYAPIVRSFFSAYFKIWGTLPPPGYVEGAARKMNLYEFMAQERKKPAFRKTKTYKAEAAKFAALRDQLLGYY